MGQAPGRQSLVGKVKNAISTSGPSSPNCKGCGVSSGSQLRARHSGEERSFVVGLGDWVGVVSSLKVKCPFCQNSFQWPAFAREVQST